VGIGSQLSQMENGVLLPVACFSRILRKHERNYTTTSKELLAVVESIKKFRIYLQNTFTLITDHRAIRWLNTSLDLKKRMVDSVAGSVTYRVIVLLSSISLEHQANYLWRIIFPALSQAL
jgi:hypothetical protein